MRRKEHASHNEDDYFWIMNKAMVGQLGLIDANGFPRVVPLNFVLVEKKVYFHGALEGEKFDILNQIKPPKIAFSVDIPFSFIPSHWVGPKMACPATMFYKSVHIRGTGHMVSSLDEKALALQKLMEKHQPEGMYLPFKENMDIYHNPLERVGVFRIDPVEITVKIKFGQNINKTARRGLINKLAERNLAIDQQTIVEIEKTLNNTPV